MSRNPGYDNILDEIAEDVDESIVILKKLNKKGN